MVLVLDVVVEGLGMMVLTARKEKEIVMKRIVSDH